MQIHSLMFLAIFFMCLVILLVVIRIAFGQYQLAKNQVELYEELTEAIPSRQGDDLAIPENLPDLDETPLPDEDKDSSESQ